MTNPGRFRGAEIIEHGGDYLLRVTTDDGACCEVIASFDQLDSLAEDIDRRLDADDE